MSYADHFLITEAQRKTEWFESELGRSQLLAGAPKGKSWRYRAAELLLRSAAQLEPRLKLQPTGSAC